MICRLCLNTVSEETAVKLFDSSEGNAETQLIKMIAKYLYLEVSQYDPISTLICQDCCEHLEDFNRFWTHVNLKQNSMKHNTFCNEFLEVKCGVELPTTADNEKDILDANNEESLLELKFVPLSWPQEAQSERGQNEEFEGAKSTEKTYDLGQMDFANDDISSMDDDVPLLDLKSKINIKTRKESAKVKKKPKKRKIKIDKSDDAESLNTDDNPLGTIAENPQQKSSKQKSESNKLIAQRHEQIVADFMSLSCDLCKHPLDNLKDLRLHFDAIHQQQSYVMCCNRKYNTARRLVEHISWHQNPDIFKCDICSKVLRSKKYLKVHKDIVHGSTQSAEYESHVTCNICNKQFKNKNCLGKHLEKHERERDYNCEMCAKSFINPQRLRKHIESIHENIFPHICDTCGKKFKFKPSFDRHLLQHQGIIEPPAQCSICGEWLKNKSGLRLHQFKHDMSDTKCQFCGRECPSRRALYGHISYVHKRKNKFQCNLCDKSFKESKNLTEHMAIHTGAQLYCCPHCSKECRSKANMYVHIKRYHVEEWIKTKIARSNDPNLKLTATEGAETDH